MIGILRRYTKTRLVQVLLWLTILSLVVGSGVLTTWRRARRGSINTIGAVNGYDISGEVFARKVKEHHVTLTKLKEQLGVDADTFLKQLGYGNKPEERVLDELINERLWQTGAQAVGASISPSYKLEKITDPAFVMDALSEYIPQEVFFAPHTMSTANLFHYLQRHGIADEEVEEMLDMALQRLLYGSLVSGAVYTPQAALKEEYIRQYGKKNYQIASFPLESYLAQAKKSDLSDEQLKNFFDEHKQQYLIPEKRNGLLWEFDPQSYGMAVADKDVQDYYIKNKRKFVKNPEEMTVDLIKFKPNEKNKAAETARKLTEKPELFQQEKKERIVLKKGSVKDKKEEEAAFALAKDGAISPVVNTQLGYEIIKRVTKKAAEYRELAEVKDEIKKTLTAEKFMQLFNKDAQRVINQAASMPSLFANFIKDKQAKETAIKNVTNDGSPKTRMLFGLKGHGRAFYQDEGKGFIVQLESVEKSHVPAWDSLKDKLSKDYYAHKAEQALQADLQKVVAQVNAGASMKDVVQEVSAGKNDIKVEISPWIVAQDPESVKELKKYGLSPQKIKLAQPGSLMAHMTNQGGYIVQLNEIEPFSEEDVAKKRALLEKQLLTSEIRLVQQAILNALRREATIDIKNI